MERTAKPKLSPAQIKVLKALSEPGAVARYGHRGKCGFGWSLPNHRFANDGTVRVLYGMNLIGGDVNMVYILPAGREYLAEMEAT